MYREQMSYPTVISALWPAGERAWKAARTCLLVFAGAAALTASAKVQVPFYPVPMTMQTFVVLTMGMVYGWRLGTATLLFYLAEGAVGLPVFAGTPAKGVGLAYMLGGTGGYLAGFLLAVAATGLLAERGWDRRWHTTALAMMVGNVLIYIPGLLWLGVLFGWDKPILRWGLLPFIAGDAAKLALAAAVMPGVWKLLNRK